MAHLKKASKAQKEKYSSKDFSGWGSKGVKSRMGNLNKKERSELMKKVRAGKKSLEKREELKEELFG